MTRRLACVLLLSDHAHLAGPAESFARDRFDVRHVSRHARSEREFPPAVAELVGGGKVDVLLNYLAPMIVPGRVLRAVRREAINFHPAPPAWPGIGSASYALYHGDATFGATAHRMTTKIDAGEIVRVIRFPVHPDDSCDTLFERALASTLTLFYDVCDELARNRRLVPTGDRWARDAITRAEFERWMTLSPNDPPDEIARKVRALRHPRFPGPFFEIDGVLSEISQHPAPTEHD
jgi:methionyl-tRNA formyltransferase